MDSYFIMDMNIEPPSLEWEDTEKDKQKGQGCEYWDCGWCYHPRASNPHGCEGFSRCSMKKKGHGDVYQEVHNDYDRGEK